MFPVYTVIKHPKDTSILVKRNGIQGNLMFMTKYNHPYMA